MAKIARAATPPTPHPRQRAHYSLDARRNKIATTRYANYKINLTKQGKMKMAARRPYVLMATTEAEIILLVAYRILYRITG